MEDSMIDFPNLADEKVGNKRVRDGEEEIKMGRLEKRPSGILGVNGGGKDSDGDGGGIIDTFFSNVFHKNDTGGEVLEVNGLIERDVVEEKSEDLGMDGSGGDGGGESGGGIINSFISNIFHHNGRGDDGGDQEKSDLLDEVVEKIEDLGGGGGDGGEDGVEPVDLNAETEKINTVPDLSGKHLTGDKLKLKPDDYSERVFFLNNN